MAIELLCRKIGMTQIFEESGVAVAVTVLDASPNLVVQKKSAEKDGYTALQLGFGDRRPSGADKARQGHFQKAGVAPKRHLAESRISAEDAEGYAVGNEIKVEIFEKGQRVDVIGISKGRGTAGVVKRHGFAVKRRTHGTHEAFRHGGAIGAGSYPGRVFKGMKMPGRMGNARTTTINVEVARVDVERGLLFVNGAVPGHNNAVVRVRQSVKAQSDS
ncbi:MAG: 50S ribosomal protein L3 [Planctomycetota bacterium]